jgi:hypothetical protein
VERLVGLDQPLPVIMEKTRRIGPDVSMQSESYK